MRICGDLLRRTDLSKNTYRTKTVIPSNFPETKGIPKYIIVYISHDALQGTHTVRHVTDVTCCSQSYLIPSPSKLR